ncbi:chitin deacetylase [Polyrhizophydium stewartii]|uniref:Chitin deacetylase n=1 Tax=Polyrhizophydium stewartii TaxID=2732419 RepID=A0ABR4NE37_9FUNG
MFFPVAVAVSLVLGAAVAALDASKYPPPLAVPPPNAEWSARFLGSLPSTVPGDIVRCRDNADYALTYDDGPSKFTPSVLSRLAKSSLKATFFVVGSQVLQNPDILLNAYRAGHEIAIHTWSHPHLPSLTSEQIVAEIMWTATIIKEVIGVTPKFMRPPYGEIDDRVRSVLRAMNLEVVIWSIDTEDWTGSKTVAQTLRDNAVKGADGTIPLEHDLYDFEASQALQAIDALMEVAKGRSFKTVSQCTGRAAYDESLLSGAAPSPSTSRASSTSTTATSAIPSSTFSARMTPSTRASSTTLPVQFLPTSQPGSPAQGGGSNGAARVSGTFAAMSCAIAFVAFAALLL